LIEERNLDRTNGAIASDIGKAKVAVAGRNHRDHG